MRLPRPLHFLLLLCFVSAFFFPAAGEWVRPGKLGVLFVPVASPTRAVAEMLSGRLSGPAKNPDTRPADAIYAENHELRAAYARLEHEVAILRKISADWEKVPLRDRCTLFPVVSPGAELGTRDSLVLQTTPLSKLSDGMFALRDHDVVGQCFSGKVRLVTDPQSKVQVYFVSYRKAKPPTQPEESGGPNYARLNIPSKLLQGAGGGRMICRNLPYGDAVDKEGLAIGDLALVDDPDWPKDLQDYRIGTVTEIKKASHLMAEIEVKPEGDLLRLREVMVLTKER